MTVESGWAYSSREQVQEIAAEMDAKKGLTKISVVLEAS